MLRRLQFPLRFLDVACVASILSLAWSATCLSRSGRRLVWIGVGLFLVGSAAMLGALERQFLAEAKPTATVAAPSNTMAGQAEMKPARAGNQWQLYLDDGGFSADCAALKLTCSETVTRTHHKAWSIQSEIADQSVRLPMFWFPGWEFSVNSQVIKPSVDPASGLPVVSLGAGTTTIEASWIGIPQERIGAWLSALSLLICCGLAMFVTRWHKVEELTHVA